MDPPVGVIGLGGDRLPFAEAKGDGLALLSYTLRDGALHLTHTEVPEVAEGQGVGSNLVRAALEHASEEKLMAVPDCPFVRSYIERHPEYQKLVHGA